MPTLRSILAIACLLTPLAPPASADSGRPITVQAHRLAPGGDGDRVGRLRVRTILHLTSDDGDFGGFSGLALDGEKLTAVSDRGHWLTADMKRNRRGVLVGLESARMGRLCDDDGAPVAWERLDAEEVQLLPGRGFLVSFERHHRLVLYRGSEAGGAAFDQPPATFSFPPAIVDTSRNKGMEAVVVFDDGRLMTFAEELRTADGDMIGWIGHPDAGDWRHLFLPAFEDYLPTGAALLPGGDAVLLMRSYSEARGNRVRLLRLAADDLVVDDRSAERRLRPIELARIEPPATIDNMEAIAVGAGPRGETLIYLLSDDNFNPAQQRTLLMQLELMKTPMVDR